MAEWLTEKKKEKKMAEWLTEFVRCSEVVVEYSGLELLCIAPHAAPNNSSGMLTKRMASWLTQFMRGSEVVVE